MKKKTEQLKNIQRKGLEVNEERRRENSGKKGIKKRRV